MQAFWIYSVVRVFLAVEEKAIFCDRFLGVKFGNESH
jgi:hypothetical protein